MEKDFRILSFDEIESLLKRPSMKNYLEDGTYTGLIDSVVFREVDCNFTSSGKRIVLNIKVVFVDELGEEIPLYLSPNFTWSEKGKLVKILEDLDCLPKAGEALDIDSMVGMKVEAVVETVDKDGVHYSNITSIKREKENQKQSTRKIPSRKSIKSILKEKDKEFLDLDDMDDEDFEI